ncbi:MAG TPA: ferrous iron transport protein B [Dehalococcoidales bacterium]|nr:ferrous iron transport protein B [Dehalococcoidales bacterium]
MVNKPSSPAGSAPKTVVLAMVGNANVGKSAIFNQLTGLEQETGNWSGKTVVLKEGILAHHGLDIKIVDLPGVYSFSAYSPDEMMTRQFILNNRPDVVINVLDATSLERNLYLTLLLKELGVPCVAALNFTDIARKKHIFSDLEKLSLILGFPVINTVAIKGIGVHELVDAALKQIQSGRKGEQKVIQYGPEIENRVSKLSQALSGVNLPYPIRWTAIKLLEKDSQITDEVKKLAPEVTALGDTAAAELSAIHGEDSATVIASERYAVAARIAQQISQTSVPERDTESRLDNLAMHPVLGYVLFFVTMAAILVFISFFGGWMAGLIESLFERFNPHLNHPAYFILWNGSVVGLYAALAVAVGFILPFYLILAWLAESGYLPRIAFMLDRPCHTLGLHGQAVLPLIMGLGCNVPACLACRILENRRDRLIATFLSTLVPCSARSSVVLGLVGAFIGWQWAVALLIFQFILIFVIGKILNKINPSQSSGIIMEIPEYRFPSFGIVWKQAWSRFRDFLTLGVPLIVAGSTLIEALAVWNWLEHITDFMSPVTVGWLGLPAFAGVLLIIGILRKEANLALLISMAGGMAVTSIMSPLQMVVFSLVILIYIPCISTIAVLVRETGLKWTLLMVVTEISLAILLGGIAYRILPLITNLR